MGPGAVEEVSDTITGGVQWLNALLLALKSDCVEIKGREKGLKNQKKCVKKYIFFKLDAKFFSPIKKHKNQMQLVLRVSPSICVFFGVFLVKKEHTFSRFPHM